MSSDEIDLIEVPANDAPQGPASGNGVGGVSSHTFNGASHGLVTDSVPADSGVQPEGDSGITSGLAAARAAQATLEQELRDLNEKRDKVLAINQRIAELEAQKATMRANLRLMTTPSSSIRVSLGQPTPRASTPASSIRGMNVGTA